MISCGILARGAPGIIKCTQMVLNMCLCVHRLAYTLMHKQTTRPSSRTQRATRYATTRTHARTPTITTDNTYAGSRPHVAVVLKGVGACSVVAHPSRVGREAVANIKGGKRAGPVDVCRRQRIGGSGAVDDNTQPRLLSARGSVQQQLSGGCSRGMQRLAGGCCTSSSYAANAQSGVTAQQTCIHHGKDVWAAAWGHPAQQTCMLCNTGKTCGRQHGDTLQMHNRARLHKRTHTTTRERRVGDNMGTCLLTAAVTAHRSNESMVDRLAFGHRASVMKVRSTKAWVMLSTGGASLGSTAFHVADAAAGGAGDHGNGSGVWTHAFELIAYVPSSVVPERLPRIVSATEGGTSLSTMAEVIRPGGSSQTTVEGGGGGREVLLSFLWCCSFAAAAAAAMRP